MKHIIVLFKLSFTTESKTQVKTVTHLKQGKHHKNPLGVNHTSTKEDKLGSSLDDPGSEIYAYR